jgi:hypothetical protein
VFDGVFTEVLRRSGQASYHKLPSGNSPSAHEKLLSLLIEKDLSPRSLGSPGAFLNLIEELRNWVMFDAACPSCASASFLSLFHAVLESVPHRGRMAAVFL